MVGIDRVQSRRLKSMGNVSISDIKPIYDKLKSDQIAPVFEGLGTHYSFIWVGTPPQRVSVILDTGSHHTAFPCVGCNCGKHMDALFDHSKSSTSVVKTCGAAGRKCKMKQSYTEGSSWSAFAVRDKVWMGAPGVNDIPNASTKSIDFEFGCQESETGLFRTQKVDGIMGLSATVDTLPFQLHNKKITSTKVFGLCFRTGGGIITLGGIDKSLFKEAPLTTPAANSTRYDGMYFIRSLKPRGWFTVKIVDILMRKPNELVGTSLGKDTAKHCNSGRGTIVDSGTTDTYLPKNLAKSFKDLFYTMTGSRYSNAAMSVTREKLDTWPVIVFRMMAPDGGHIDVEVFPTVN